MTDGASYYQVPGAVNGGRYAGGFIGKIDLGSAASVGGGLDLLGENVSLSNLLEALNVVVTTIEHSDVYGGPGGYVVLATAQDNSGYVGHAGGFAGVLYGGHIQDSNAHNFSHILGRKTAGGYVGEMRPGDVASVLDEGTILEQADQSGQSALRPGSLCSNHPQQFHRQRALRRRGVGAGQRRTAQETGMAGGYVGHNEGGQIRGLDTKPGIRSPAMTMPSIQVPKYMKAPPACARQCASAPSTAACTAGGYTGFMEAADTAEGGGLSLLGGLIKVDSDTCTRY